MRGPKYWDNKTDSSRGMNRHSYNAVRNMRRMRLSARTQKMQNTGRYKCIQKRGLPPNLFFFPFSVSRRRSPNGSQHRFSRRVMRKNDDAARPWCLGPRLDGHLPGPGSDRGQFVDVIDENASHAGGMSESVEWSSGRPVVIFNFSIKAQVGRLMVAICSSGCVSTVDLILYGATRTRRYRDGEIAVARIARRRDLGLLTRGRRRIPFGVAERPVSGTNIKIGRRTPR